MASLAKPAWPSFTGGTAEEQLWYTNAKAWYHDADKTANVSLADLEEFVGLIELLRLPPMIRVTRATGTTKNHPIAIRAQHDPKWIYYVLLRIMYGSDWIRTDPVGKVFVSNWENVDWDSWAVNGKRHSFMRHPRDGDWVSSIDMPHYLKGNTHLAPNIAEARYPVQQPSPQLSCTSTPPPTIHNASLQAVGQSQQDESASKEKQTIVRARVELGTPVASPTSSISSSTEVVRSDLPSEEKKEEPAIQSYPSPTIKPQDMQEPIPKLPSPAEDNLPVASERPQPSSETLPPSMSSKPAKRKLPLELKSLNVDKLCTLFCQLLEDLTKEKAETVALWKEKHEMQTRIEVLERDNTLMQQEIIRLSSEADDKQRAMQEASDSAMAAFRDLQARFQMA
ncbi:hypothetical protein B0I35DRAFT_499739 [Stachybotrys elegans]|uniref:Uncharacterized protein n=1 Tax=Stachybotrys elegans TaxID=80388 RepID=A0A8K0SZP2_9HYPO|nr:hypothetical protein B0I35DRAFT_499739 [Stachybotrys elegans]